MQDDMPVRYYQARFDIYGTPEDTIDLKTKDVAPELAHLYRAVAYNGRSPANP